MNESMHQAEEPGAREFADRAGAMLRDGADQLDGATLSRLNRARQAALAEYDRKAARPVWLRFGWQPAAVVATIAALAVAIALLGPPRPDSGPGAAMAGSELHASDMEVLLADDNLDLFDDVEFYDWVEPNESPEEAAQGLAG